jgi:indolepyruvate ferredoxin oxidoreductase
MARRRAATLLDAAALPSDVREVCEPRAADLVDYQSAALARRYVDVVQEVAQHEMAVVGTTDIAREVARSYYKLLAYKDEYEVARLHLQVDVGSQARDELGVPVKVRYHLHPPVLRSFGMKRKLEVGEWIRPAFRVLRAMRRVRGTRLDVFGMTELRRIERSLPEEYLAAVRELMASLSTETADRVRAVAASADLVRGYEHVKLECVDRFRAALAEALEE